VNLSVLPVTFIKALIVLFPWSLKRILLQFLFRYQLAPTAHIGFAWVYPRNLRMDTGSRIDDFTVAVNLDALILGKFSSIGRSNWITGFSTSTTSSHFAHQPKRSAELLLGDHSAITKNHHIDATNKISIGSFTTIAGYRSQFLSHSIDLYFNRQHSDPILIGDYCFVGSGCIVLGGSILPDHSVLGALSLLNKPFNDPWTLYAGQPAKIVKSIDKDAAFFSRTIGFVY
jgi:acetyltransferase-like isoleucine patch superfamily enzyme